MGYEKNCPFLKELNDFSCYLLFLTYKVLFWFSLIFLSVKIISITLTINTNIQITVRVGKATLRHAMSADSQPPMSRWGKHKAMILARNIPIFKPNCIFKSPKMIPHAANASISIPMPSSAWAVQWQMGRLLAEIPQQPDSSGTAQQSSVSPVDVITGSQTLNKNCGPKAIKRPHTIMTELKIMLFFTLSPWQTRLNRLEFYIQAV